MSFLADLINDARSEFGKTSPNLKTAVTKFKNAITKTLDVLQADNLRIFDGNDGGVVRGPKKSRAKCENGTTGNLLCRKQYLTKGELEVPYFRAVFNSPAHKFTLSANSDLIVRLIGYESPLMRKNRGNENPEISSRTISCDLVGLTSDNRILCIEGKVKPHNRATDIVYGLLESFAYGVCIEYFLSDAKRLDLFKREVQACANEFHKTANGFDENKLSAAFSLAAPKEYFAEYFNPSQPRHEKAKKRLGEAGQMLDIFQRIKGPAWAGFLILEPPCCVKSIGLNDDKMLDGKEYIEPHFKSESLNVDLAKDIDALKQALRLRGATI